jgi:MATE family multidrug resistance protein
MHQPREQKWTLWRVEARATAALASPLVLTNVAQALIHATDVVLLGWVGARTLAAGTLGINLYFAFQIFGMGLVTAAAPLIARELGRKAHSVRDVRRTVRQTMWAAIAIAAPIWAILWNAEAILLTFGQEPALARDAAALVRPLQWGLLPFLLYLVLRNFLAALERPGWSLAIGIAAVCFNALVNYSLIFGKFGLPALGLTGAGIGSALSNLFMFVALAAVVTLHPRFRRYRLFGHFWRSDWPRFRDVWTLGLPIGVTLALEVTIFNAAVFLMGLISASSIAAHAIAIQIAALTFMVPMGLAQAATVRVGIAYGRKDKEGIARAGWTAFAMGVGFMMLTAILMWSFPHTLISAFLDTHDPANAEVVRLAAAFLAVAALFQIVDGAQVVGAGMLRGLHDTRVPMVYAALGYWVVGLGTAIFLAFGAGWEGVGIWTGLAAGLAAVSVLMLWRWTGRERLGLLA